MDSTQTTEPKAPPAVPIVQIYEEEDLIKKANETIKKLFLNIVLGIVVCLYIAGGAKLFLDIEQESEMEGLLEAQLRTFEIDMERQEMADALWDQKYSQAQLSYDDLVEKLIEEYHANLTAAIDNFGYDGLVWSDADIEGKTVWTYVNAVIYTVTVVTTIGYGTIVCSTTLGQMVTILYSLIGIPLLLMFLANIGEYMAYAFRMAYGRGCCYLCNQKMNETHTEYRERHEFESEGVFTDRTGLDDETPEERLARVKAKQLDEIRILEQSTDMSVNYEEINVPIIMTVSLIVLYCSIGAVLFSEYNDWTYITGAYFCFVTLSTIGFGDLTPGWEDIGTSTGNIKFITTSLYILFGLALLSMCFNLMIEEVLQKTKWLGRKLGIIKENHAMEEKKNWQLPPPDDVGDNIINSTDDPTEIPTVTAAAEIPV